MARCRGCRNETKKKLGMSNTPYDGGWWITDGGWWVADGGWWVTDGGWWVTDGGWWVATIHQRVDAIVQKKGGERPYGTPWRDGPSQVVTLGLEHSPAPCIMATWSSTIGRVANCSGIRAHRHRTHQLTKPGLWSLKNWEQMEENGGE